MAQDYIQHLRVSGIMTQMVAALLGELNTLKTSNDLNNFLIDGKTNRCG